MKKFVATALIALSVASVAQARVYTCELNEGSGFKKVLPSAMILDFDSQPGSVVIRDDIGASIGHPIIVGSLGRTVGNDRLFQWVLKNVPRSLKPTDTYLGGSNNVMYSGRLNRANGSLKIVAKFRKSHSEFLVSRADGTCR